MAYQDILLPPMCMKARVQLPYPKEPERSMVWAGGMVRNHHRSNQLDPTRIPRNLPTTIKLLHQRNLLQQVPGGKKRIARDWGNCRQPHIILPLLFLWLFYQLIFFTHLWWIFSYCVIPICLCLKVCSYPVVIQNSALNRSCTAPHHSFLFLRCNAPLHFFAVRCKFLTGAAPHNSFLILRCNALLQFFLRCGANFWQELHRTTPFLILRCNAPL